MCNYRCGSHYLSSGQQYSRTGIGRRWIVGQIQHITCFFIGTWLIHLFTYLFMPVFLIDGRADKWKQIPTIYLAKPKIFPIWPFSEKISDPCSSQLFFHDSCTSPCVSLFAFSCCELVKLLCNF